MKKFFGILFGGFITFWVIVFCIGLAILLSIDIENNTYRTKCNAQGGVAVKGYSSSLVCIPYKDLIDVK